MNTDRMFRSVPLLNDLKMLSFWRTRVDCKTQVSVRNLVCSAIVDSFCSSRPRSHACLSPSLREKRLEANLCHKLECLEVSVKQSTASEIGAGLLKLFEPVKAQAAI